ncbi:MAG: DEAD/DEAH box helicase [Moritella sp.]|uniref:3'-5' exonuclease n=1 Tax=Moritella sp. TaxID=78556 RepID=UPI001D2E4057|nr:3'-5' exonuclease [Moritella sp.]NQZ52427.1 DEAD/DEAH box helicase [Moritella sp.]
MESFQMRCLQNVTPTAEQLQIVSRNRPGIEVIRGAAGSGKTTTALLRLKSLIGLFLNRRQREANDAPVKILVLTYNTTLRGYINELIKNCNVNQDEIELTVNTFAKWTVNLCGKPKICSNRKSIISDLGSNIKLSQDFLADEIEYLLGRFRLDNLEAYYEAVRVGRGITPRVDKTLRSQIVQEVVLPYLEILQEKGEVDWADIAMKVTDEIPNQQFDIIICDETQDFTANQIRAIKSHLAEVSSLTLVVDTAQRIYAGGFRWIETGITVLPGNSFRLQRNYRNTQEIAAFAAPLISGIPTDDDFTIPDFSSSSRQGSKPIVIAGSYSNQVSYAIQHIENNIDLTKESVAFLHPKGWRWFHYLEERLNNGGFKYISISRKPEWPEGDANIALSTLHSAKGLEFDHVIIIGLNRECLLHWDDITDHRYITTRKLLAMGIGRAKETVILGYKPEDKSEIIDLLQNDTYISVTL